VSTVELSRPPTLAALYRRAALRALTRRSTGSVPERTLVLRGVTVDRGRLAAYDRACGFPLADPLPPTYPHVLAFPLAMELMSAADFPFPVVGLVHLTNRITVARPVLAGETLDLAVHAENLRPHDRGRQVDVVAVATVDGVQVWRGVSTYLRGEAAGRGVASREATSRDAMGGEAADRDAMGGEAAGRDAASPAGGDRPGRPSAPPPDALWQVPRIVGRDYAAVSGDRNPIHTSRVAARLFGFARPIAHGMWSKARCLAALAGRLPDAYQVEVGFKLPILLPASVAFTATPGAPAASGGWAFTLHDARSGKPHLTGTVTATAPGPVSPASPEHAAPA